MQGRKIILLSGLFAAMVGGQAFAQIASIAPRSVDWRSRRRRQQRDLRLLPHAARGEHHYRGPALEQAGRRDHVHHL